MSNHHFKEKAMSLKAKGLLSLMLSLPDDWNYSIAGLVKLSKDGKDSVMSALAELEEFGYLVRHKKTNSKGQFSGVEYNIYEEPQRDIPSAVKQNADNEKAAKQNAEKPSQLNTNSLNTNFIKDTNKLIPKELEAVIASNVVNEEIRALYRDYVLMREDIKAPITERGMLLLINRCDRLSNCNIRVQKILLEAAIINNWKSVYLPKEEEIKEANKEVLNELKSFYGVEEE
jgi:hypothetical protein